MTDGTPDPTRDRGRFAERLREAGLSTCRFINVPNGKKGGRANPANHQNPENWRSPGDSHLSGNYGVHPGAGTDATAFLVEFDVDDYDDTEDTDALDALDETFSVESPHTPAGESGHHYYRVEGSAVGVLEELTSTLNPEPAWGEIKAEGKYIVGPGSQLDGCSKEWCDECDKSDGGYYRIANDVPIATLTRDDLEAVVRGDSELGSSRLPNGGGTEAGGSDSEDKYPTSETGESPSGDGSDAPDAMPPCYRAALKTRVDPRDATVNEHEVSKHAALLGLWAGYDADDVAEHMTGEFAPGEHAGINTDADETRYQVKKLGEKANRDSPLRPPSPVKLKQGGILPEFAADDCADRCVIHTTASRDGGTAAASADAGTDGAVEDVETHSWDDLPFYNQQGNVDTRRTRRVAADILLETHWFATPTPQGTKVDSTPLYHYYEAEGFFERAGAAWVHRYVGRKVPELESADMKEVVSRVKRGSFIDRDTFDGGAYDDALVNLSNGVYNLDTGELLDHSPDYRFRTSIPRTYDPDAECPNITEFIEEIVPGEQEQQTLFEWIGYCLEIGYPIHRFLILYGDGRNGKSRYFGLIREFLESDNVSGVTLDTIGGNGFGVSALDENLLNVDTESADTRLGPAELNTLKALTGGDQRQVDVKYQEPYEMENDAKLAFAANNPPRFEEDTDAIADRLLTIELPYRFANDANADKEPIPERQLMRRLTTDEELSGLLNKALEGLQRVRERGYFSIEEDVTSRERFEEYQEEADSIVGFASHCLKNDNSFAMPKSAVFNAYKGYCAENGHTPAEYNAFFRQLGRKADVETHTKQPKISGADGEVWRPRVLDHCWVTADGLAHLSRGAREDTLKAIRHMHSGNGDYAEDFLLRTNGSREIAQGERMTVVTDAIAELCQRDDGTEHARYGDIVNVAMDAGLDESAVDHALDKLSEQGAIYQPGTGEYRLNS